MPPVNDVTKEVNFLYRPVGYKNPNGKKVTQDDIDKWVRKEKPGFIKSLPNFSVIGVGITILSALLGLFGLKKDNKFCKRVGAVFTLGGLIPAGFGMYLANLMSTTSKEYKSQGLSSLSDDEKNLLNDLRNIAKVEKSKRPQLRKELLEKYKDLIEKYRKDIKLPFTHPLESKIEGAIFVEGLSDEDNPSRELMLFGDLLNQEHEVKIAIDLLKDKSADKEKRECEVKKIARYPAELTNQTLVGALVKCALDKTDDGNVRDTSLVVLRYMDFNFKTDTPQLTDFLISSIKDKSEYPAVRHSSMKLLIKLKGKEAIEYLLPTLNDKTDILRGSAITELEEIGDESVLGILQEIAREPRTDDGEHWPPWFRADKAIDKIKERLASKDKGINKQDDSRK